MTGQQGGKYQSPRGTITAISAKPGAQPKVTAWCYISAGRGLRPCTHRWSEHCPVRDGEAE